MDFHWKSMEITSIKCGNQGSHFSAAMGLASPLFSFMLSAREFTYAHLFFSFLGSFEWCESLRKQSKNKEIEGTCKDLKMRERTRKLKFLIFLLFPLKINLFRYFSHRSLDATMPTPFNTADGGLSM